MVLTKGLPRSLILLLLIGFIDLASTAVLHARGMIVELNPVMRPIINHSEWTFVFVKGVTLLFGGWILARQAPTHGQFVRKACLSGSFAYVAIWVCWFLIGQF